MGSGTELLELGPDAEGASALESLVVLHVCLLGALLLMLPVLAAQLPYLADDYALVASHLDADGRLDPATLLDDFGPPRAGVYYRPVFYLSFALDFLLQGARPQLSYIMNTLFHGAVAWLLFLLLRALAAGRGWALLSALLFLCHPVHLEAVAWISARTATLGTAFLLAATVAHVRFRRRGGTRSLVGLALFTALGLGSRADVLMLPAILGALDLLVLPRGTTTARRRALPYLLVGLVFALWLVARELTTSQPLARWGTTLSALADPEIRGRMLASLGRVLVPRVTSLTSGTAVGGDVLVALPSVLLLLASLIALRQREGRRLAGFGLALALLGCVPLVPIMRISEDLSSSRGLYLPSVGWCVLLGAAATAAAGHGAAWRRGLARVAIVLALVGGCGLFVFNAQAYVLAGQACARVLAAVTASGARAVVVPRSGSVPFSDRQGDGVRNDGGVLFGPRDEAPAPEPDAAAPQAPAELVVLVNLPRMVHGVHVFWGDVRPAFGPLLGGPGVEVIYTDLPFGPDAVGSPSARLFGRLLIDEVPLLKWDGERLQPSQVVAVRDVSPLADELARARVVSLGALQRAWRDDTELLTLPASDVGFALYRYAAYTSWGVLHFAAHPEQVGDRLEFAPWDDDPGDGATMDRATELARRLPERARRHREQLPSVLFVEVVDFDGRLVARSEPVLWWLPMDAGD